MTATGVPPPRHALPTWSLPLVGVLLSGAMTGAVLLAGHVHPDDAVHEGALFVHLASLVLGFGSVLQIDWVGLQWVLGHRNLAAVLETARNAQAPIWIGLAGLTLSGVLLEPDVNHRLTQIKLGLVLLVTWNGLLAGALHRKLARGTTRRPAFLLAVAALSAGISQAGWWGAMVIGFVNH